MNVGLLAARDAPECGARTRAGGRCMRKALRGKRRCRLHGGLSPGVPGNKNALKHGRYSHEAIERQRREREFVRRAAELLRELAV